MIIDLQNISSAKIYSRIVSLVPSQTELLYSLGLEEEVIAITKFCIHPHKWFTHKTRIGGTKTIKIDLIKNLHPDLIFANKEENVKEQIEELSLFCDVLISDVNNLNDALAMIKTIGSLTGKYNQALLMANTIELKFQTLINNSFLKRKINTTYLIWKEPCMAAGGNTFINDMMQYCGLKNFYTSDDRYPKINLNDLRNSNSSIETCELILLSSEPFPFKENHIAEIQQQIPSIKIMLTDGEMFSWYGSRLLLAADYFEKFQNEIALLFH
jgi:ABC-type Fe3+-hydroxamate transport system substrate-binding protein